MAISGNEVISVGGHRKNTDLRNYSRISNQCTRPAFDDKPNFCRWPQKKHRRTYGTVHAFRSNVQKICLSLRTRCVQGGQKNQQQTTAMAAAVCSSHGRAPRLYHLTCKLPGHLCLDGMDGKNIPDEEIAAAGAVGASMIEHWSTVSDIAVVWSG